MTETASASSALAEGKQLGRYRLQYLLGAGGMGAAVTELNAGTTLEDETDAARAIRRTLPFASIRA